MKLCFECSEYPPGLHGGIGSLVQILARGFVKAGHEVRVVGLYPASNGSSDYEDDCGVQVWRLRIPAYPYGWVLARLRLFAQVHSWCDSGDIDLIEVPDFNAPAAGWRALPVPVIVRLSGSGSYFATEMGQPVPWVAYKMDRTSIRRGDFICATSRYIGMRNKSVFGLSSEPDAFIYNPVNVPEVDPHVERVPHMVVFAGTLAEKKGVISLARSWLNVKKACSEAELHFWGKDVKTKDGGSMQRFLESLFPEGLRDSVYFHGHVALDTLLEVFAKAGMAVLPSYAEGFALTPLHAMAAGCPTIYTKRGSGPELIEHGHNGMLVDPDRPDEIAAAIVSLLKDPGLANRLGRLGRHLVEEKFSWPMLYAQNENFYRASLQRFRRNRNKRI